MATVFKCDRCDKVFDWHNPQKYIISENKNFLFRDERQLDLCDDCYNKLIDFLNIDKEKTDE